jgi:hypothetical protein
VATQVVPGSADDTSDHALAEAARKVLDEINAQELARIAALFAARASDGRATTDIAQAARAATFGAVDTLVVDMNNTVSGFVDETTGAVTIDAAPDAVNYGVVDEIARRVLQSGGRVLSARRADVPRAADLAAILRYAV